MSRKKKPSHLYDKFESASEDGVTDAPLEEESRQRYSVIICRETEQQPKCFLCGNVVKGLPIASIN